MLDESRISLLNFNDFFNRQTLERAMANAEAGRATVDGVKPGDGKLRIVGTCRAGKNKLYRQDIQLANDGVRLINVAGICSCAEGYNCQHVAAVLLTWRDANLHHAEDSSAAEDEQSASLETQAWLQAIEQPAAELPRPGSQQILYVLSTDDFRLTLYKARLGKADGKVGRPELLRPDMHRLTWGNVPGFFQPADMPILRLFLALQDNVMFTYESALALRGEEGAQLLRMALRTGRLHLESVDRPVLRAGPTLDTRLAWRRDAAGRQQLQIAEDGDESLQLLPTWPPWYLSAARNQVGPVRLDLPEDIAFQLLAAPPLDELDALLVRQRLGEIGTARQLALPLPEAAEPELPEGKPQAVLRLEAAQFGNALRTRGGNAQAVATLWFEYPGLPRVAGSERPATLLHTLRDGRALTLLRDRDSESAAWRLLQAHGLETYRKRLGKLKRLDAATDCLLPENQDLDGWLDFLDQTVPRLKEAGMRVEIAENFPYQLREAEDWFVEVIDDDVINNDWFDLDLGVVIDGTRVSLVEPLARLIAQRPHLLEELRLLPAEERVPLALDERHVLPVPVQRLRAWLGPLLEFSGEHEHLRISRLHATVLNELDKLPGHWLGGERLRELGQRLRDFTGIEETLPAPGFKAVLRPYQQLGLNWLQFLRSYGLAGILADDMGLGKTVQTLAHLHLEKHSGRADLPSLVVMPTSLIANWCSEARQFAPSLKVLALHGPARAPHFAAMKDVDVILTTYPLLVRDREILLAQEYHLLVLDEAQFIKNPKAQSHRVARQLKARHRLSLTGTPLENHLGELWAQYNFLLPGLLGDVRRFAAAFRAPIEKQGDVERSRQLAERVRPFLLRRTKEQVLTDLPPKTEIIRWVELAGAQRDLYESLRLAFDKKLRQVLYSRGVAQSQIMILDALLKLRQACCDPRLVKLHGAMPAAESMESAKLELLLEMITELLDEGRRILLFSQFTSMLKLIEDELELRGIRFVKLTGQTKDRETPIRSFQNGEVPLFLISLKAGGAGLNLTAADSVIHYDPWWNPAVEEQASARAHRIGQDKPVFVYKLLTQGTVEEKILALQERKRGLADNLLDGAAPNRHLITAEDLDVLFQPLTPE
jgi:superfamily II DNA or RNA helicase